MFKQLLLIAAIAAVVLAKPEPRGKFKIFSTYIDFLHIRYRAAKLPYSYIEEENNSRCQSFILATLLHIMIIFNIIC